MSHSDNCQDSDSEPGTINILENQSQKRSRDMNLARNFRLGHFLLPILNERHGLLVEV